MEGLVEFLLKYRPSAFARGSLAFAPPIPVWMIWLLVAAIAAFGVLQYARSAESLGRRDRVILGVLRFVAVAALGFSLARPVLVIAESVTQRNIVAVLIDDSRSMRIADVGGQPRSQAVSRLVGAADSSLLKALSPRYQTRVFRVSSSGRVNDPAALSYDGTRTRLLTSMLRVQDELAGAPLAGIVVLSDGADNSTTSGSGTGLTEQMLTLRSRGVPVYAVGIGSPRFERDVEIARIDAPRSVLKNSTVLLTVVVVQRGLGGTRLPVVVEDSGRIVGSASVLMPKDGEAVQVRVRVPATETGARLLRVHVPVQAGEMVKENNERRTLLVVRDRREKILYLEGEPRFELSFARRAVDGDPNIQLVALLRSAKDKFLRLGVDDSLELSTGFPTTREELFAYRGVVLGSVEASFFTADQLRMLSDFVSERGGGLLFLGGRSAYTEGGYAGTPLSDAFPFELGLGNPDTLAHEIKAEPTPLGTLHPALQIGANDSVMAATWDTLPPLTTVNTLLRTKPGATVLLNGQMADGRSTRPLLAVQRFGRGRVLGMAAQDTWLWQMHATIAVSDSTHETLWRQMLRWLVSEVPDRVEVAVPEESGPGEAVQVQAMVSDKAFLRSNGASVTGEVAGPTGPGSRMAFDWMVDHDGEYTASFVPDKSGVHEVMLRSVAKGDTTSSRAGYVRVAEPADEHFGAELRSSLLRQVASETGGGYYTPETAANIARDIVYSPSGSTIVKQNDLWDMPLVLILLLVALGGEWVLRRRRGLA
ncbi:MAG: hypothetical protein H7066_07510 [Cytophagaceae bacterium]|nr:hypothetical protein [Gemmatimonadaceae bacterium]